MTSSAKAVADQLVKMRRHAWRARRPRLAGSTPGRIVADLRRPRPSEDAIPCYRANIADRTRDPGLATFAFQLGRRTSGAAAARRTANEAAVNRQMDAMAPTGDAASFRAAVQSSVDARIADADRTAEQALAAIEAAQQRLAPTVPYAEARGATVRAGSAMRAHCARRRAPSCGRTSAAKSIRHRWPKVSAALGTTCRSRRRAVVGDLGAMFDIPRSSSGARHRPTCRK